MNVRTAFLAAVLLLVPFQAGFAEVQLDQWIAKARAAVGSESALKGVTSVRFIGTLESIEKVPAKEDPAKLEDQVIRLSIDIVFQKPYRHRTVLRAEKTTRTTVLDGFDGWIRVVENAEGGRSQFTMLESAQIKELRANTWENLSFFLGIEGRGGRVEYRGEAEMDGKPCVVLAFIHSDAISFTRYFDKISGVLVKSVTENGSELIELGSVVVNGIRFPKTFINKTPDGQSSTITLEVIKVNEPLPETDFAYPDEAFR